jgi:hypothetical protein
MKQASGLFQATNAEAQAAAEGPRANVTPPQTASRF